MSSGAIRMPNSQSMYFVGKNDYISFNEPRNHTISICMSGNEPSVTLNSDGTVTFHEGYPLNEVAQKFWECMAYCNPLQGELERLKKENERLKSNMAALWSLDLPVGTTLVRVEFDGSELRARKDVEPWQTVKVGF